MSKCDLLALQSAMKKDPEGYEEDFMLQLRHYEALRGLFALKPSKDHKEFSDLVSFIAHASMVYKDATKGFPDGVVELLERHYAILDPALRKNLTSALILLRNKGVIGVDVTLPLFFKLFKVKDKQLRIMMFKHIVTDAKAANKNKVNDKYNRTVQSFLHSAVKDENEAAAKKALAVLTEMYRRNIWTDAKTVNLVVEACRHPSQKILIAALKFFEGQDEAAEAAAMDGDESDSDEDPADREASMKSRTQVSKEDVFKAYKTGVASSKKKKQKKLKRTIKNMQRKERKADNAVDSRFAAMHLINDPQAFAELLFGKLQVGHMAYETKMLVILVMCRIIGMHQLIMLNVYPFLQRYIQPNQNEVTRLLAAAATACHELVPPDALEPMLRQLVNQFIHDRARPEVAAVGLNAVREICARCPLVMNEDLLQDLSEYKKARDKPVSNAARGLIALFRELAPGLLEKKDRGKGADMTRELKQFGENIVADRVDGADLLQRDMLKRKREAEAAEEDSEEGEYSDDDGSEDEGEEDFSDEGDEDSDDEDGDEEEEDKITGKRGREEGEDVDPNAKRRKNGKLSLSELKRRHKELIQKRKAEEEAEIRAEQEAEEAELGGPVEQERILTEEDFRRIKALRTEKQLNAALTKAGANKASERGADEMRLLMRRADRASDRRVNPDSLAATGLRKAHDKASRLATVLAGREDNEYGSSKERKQKKTGGSSNKEKSKKKNLPLAARVHKASRRRNAPVQKGQQQRGRKAWK